MKLLLLFVPCVVALWVPLYNSDRPGPFRHSVLLLVPAAADPDFGAERFMPLTGLGSAEHVRPSQCRRDRRLHILFRAGDGARLSRRALEGRRSRPYSRMGSRRRAIRTVDHLVSARRRSLYRLYGDRRAGARLRRRRLRLFRRALHDHHLSVHFSDHAEAMGGFASPRLHDRGRLRARPLREPLARAGGRADRHPRDHALYRAAARRTGEGHRRAGLFGRRADASTRRSPSPS